MQFRKLAFFLAITLPFSAAATLRADDLVDTAVQAGNFKTLVAAVQAAGLVDTLKGKGPFTVFAPTDEAFSKLPEGTLETLLKPENKGLLTAILTYHVVPARVAAKDAFLANSAPTVNGQRVVVSRTDNRLQVGGANVVATDIACSNGIIHVIDQVILPADKSIVEVAQSAGTFGTLIAAAKAAGLASVLAEGGPFTVFAPTDEAFAKLPEGTVANLLKPENKDQLAAILKYHVVTGRVYSDQAVKAGRAKTLQGQAVEVGYSASGLSINESNVVAADLNASNGVIHVIDAVLLPKKMSVTQARELLEDAVRRGATTYNHGNHAGCCKIYQEACQTLLDASDAMPEMVTTILTHTMKEAMSTHHMGQRAWVLRHGIDRVYHGMQ